MPPKFLIRCFLCSTQPSLVPSKEAPMGCAQLVVADGASCLASSSPSPSLSNSQSVPNAMSNRVPLSPSSSTPQTHTARTQGASVEVRVESLLSALQSPVADLCDRLEHWWTLELRCFEHVHHSVQEGAQHSVQEGIQGRDRDNSQHTLPNLGPLREAFAGWRSSFCDPLLPVGDAGNRATGRPANPTNGDRGPGNKGDPDVSRKWDLPVPNGDQCTSLPCVPPFSSCASMRSTLIECLCSSLTLLTYLMGRNRVRCEVPELATSSVWMSRTAELVACLEEMQFALMRSFFSLLHLLRSVHPPTAASSASASASTAAASATQHIDSKYVAHLLSNLLLLHSSIQSV